MTRLYTDGAEMGDILSLHGTSLVGTGATFTASTTQKRSGAYSYRAFGTTTDGQAMGFINIPATDSIYIRMGFYPDVFAQNHTMNVASLNAISTSANSVMAIVLNSNTKVFQALSGGAAKANGTTVINTGGWHLIEIYFYEADSGGRIVMYLDGLLEIDYTGDTKPGTGTTFSRIYFGDLDYTTSDTYCYFDDIAINDTNGSEDNGWCGNGHVIKLTPEGNGDKSELLGSDGDSVDNYLLVNDYPYDTTTYVQSATASATDLYNLTACGLTNVNIFRVWGENRAIDTTTGSGTMSIILKTESVEYESGSVALSTAYGGYSGSAYRLNPNTSSAWTTTQLDALQGGMKVII